MTREHFTLDSASAVFQVSVVDLRNWIKRKILRNVGDVPLAGQPRRFDLTGMYEIGLVLMLMRQGYSLVEAGNTISQMLDGEPDLSSMRDSKKPTFFIWAPGIESSGNINIARGLEDLQPAFKRLKHRLKIRGLQYSPVISMLNVTEALAAIDAAIAKDREEQ